MKIFLVLIVFTICSISVHAQIANGVQQLHTVLETVYDQMITLSSQLLLVSQAIAGIGASFYIGYRVWKHIANAEPIDFFPLFRPFALILLIGIFPKVLDFMNAVLKPTVAGTADMVKNANQAVSDLLAARANAVQHTTEWQVLVGPTGSGDRAEWYKYTHNGATESVFTVVPDEVAFMMSKVFYNVKYFIKYLISLVLEVIYYAASLVIDTIRTFHLIILAILGPFVFAFAAFDGFQQSLIQWIARYINIYLWLPIANIFGAILATIEQNMLKLDLSAIQQNGTAGFFSSTDLAYLIFMVIGIIGYLTIPGIANYIVHPHTVNPIMSKINNMTTMMMRSMSRSSTGGGGSTNSSSSEGSSGSNTMYRNTSNTVDNSDEQGANSYQKNKISG